MLGAFSLGTIAGLAAGGAGYHYGKQYLDEYRSWEKSLAEKAPWGVMISDRMIWNKDGSYTAVWIYNGPDLSFESPRQADHLARRVHRALGFLGQEGFMLHCDSVRVPSNEYRSGEGFPTGPAAFVDDVRRKEYEGGEHYENLSFLAVTFRPPDQKTQKFTNFLYESTFGASEEDWRASLSDAESRMQSFQDRLPDALGATRLSGDDLTTYLHLILTGRNETTGAPDGPAFLDYLFTEDLRSGFQPKLGDRWHRIVSIQGYADAYVGILEPLLSLSFPYRLNTRLIGVEQTAARKLVKRRMSKWISHSQDLVSQMMGSTEEDRSQYQDLFEDQAGKNKAKEAAEARRKLSGGETRLFHHSACVIVWDEDIDEANRKAREVEKQLRTKAGSGFQVAREKGLATQALMGSWPGCGNENVRRYPILSDYASRLLPITNTWAGPEENPCSMYPGESPPPLFYASTQENTPYRFTSYDGDVGHQMIIGPTGSGKSVLMGFQALRHLQYTDSQVILLDSGNSFAPLCEALGGTRYDVGGDTDVGFQPLARIDAPQERRWALGWILSLLKFQNVDIHTRHRSQISETLETMAGSGDGDATPASYRTLQELQTQIQNQEIKDALQPYCGGGALGMLLDSQNDSMAEASRFQVIELSALLELPQEVYTPVLLYLIHRIEQMLDPERPTFVGADEFFLVAAESEVGREYALEAFRTYRKKNAMMTVASQLPEDVIGEEMKGVLSSCPTQIFLPNINAEDASQKEGYHQVGLSDPEIEVIANATPKREYIARQPRRTRKFDLALSDAELSLMVQANDLSLLGTARKMREYKEEYGEHDWLPHWLRYSDLKDSDEYVEKAEAFADAANASQKPSGEKAASTSATAEAAAGLSSNGQSSNGQSSNGQSSNGQSSNGQSSNDQSADGQSTESPASTFDRENV